MANEICIGSLNIRGLRNTTKRKAIFNYLRHNKVDIICLQESFITDNIAPQIKREWGGNLFYISGTTRSNGLVTLISKKLIYDRLEIKSINNRILLIKIGIQGAVHTIVNCYAPNYTNEKIIFLEQLTNALQDNETDFTWVAGDFNIAMNKIDNVVGLPHPEKEIRHLKETIASLNLHDAWRCHHNNATEYTWSRPTPFTARRIDYIFCDAGALTNIKESEIKTCPLSDHKLVKVIMQVNRFQRGPGYWKFNSSLLHDIEYTDQANKLIDQHLQEQEGKDAEMVWELLKIKLKSHCIQYSINKPKPKLQIHEQLKHLTELENALCRAPLNEDIQKQIQKKKQEIEIRELKAARGAQIRSRIKWIENGEKNTKYFLNLEKKRCSSNLISSLRIANNTTSNPGSILQEIKSFYEKLYKKEDPKPKNITQDFLGNESHPNISDFDREKCDEDFTMDELTEALKTLNKHSSPGLDGLTPQFYLHFWEKLKGPFFNCINISIQRGRLSHSLRKGVITLIHKDHNLDRNNLTNYRPITLTNTDYKIYTKALATRLQNVITQIIHEDQVGFIKGRNMASHLRLMDDITSYLRNADQPGALIALDFSKAFDTLSKTCILEALNIFNFGPKFIQFIATTMEQTESCIHNGGWLSECFPTERGIRQGCPLSPLLFVIAVEILAIKLRNCKDITGIQIQHGELTAVSKIKQLADDTTLTLKNENDIALAIEIIDDFTYYSGLKLNKLKCKGIWLGSRKQEYGNTSGIPMINGTLKILGIYFSAHVEASLLNDNWTNKIEAILRIIKSWEQRNPTIYGKVILIKTLLLSQLSFVLQALAIPDKTLAYINLIFYRFLWKRKNNNKKAFEKIKRNVLCLKPDEGGLNMINVEHQQRMFLVRWASKLLKENNDQFWSLLSKQQMSHFPNIVSTLNANVTSTQIRDLDKINSYFWRQVLTATLHINANRLVEKAHTEPLWNNKNITFKGRPMYYPQWAKAGINHLQDMWSNGSILTYDEIKERVGAHAGLMLQYNVVYNAVPRQWKTELNLDTQTYPIVSDINTEAGYLSKLSNKKIREIFIHKQNFEICAVPFWRRKFNIDIQNYFGTAHECTKESRLRLLHFKFIHNIYPTNIMLQKMGVTESNKCMWCPDIDYIEHAFFGCRKLKHFWKMVQQHILSNLNYHINITETVALFGLPKTYAIGPNLRNQINFIILIAKLSISKFKYGNCKHLELIFETEMNIRKKT